MEWQKAISVFCTGACAVGFLALPSIALADPNSAFFSQQLNNQQAEQQQGPWPDSTVNIPQLTSTTGTSGPSSVDLGAISAGQGGALGGSDGGLQALGSALSVPTSLVGPGATNPAINLGGGTGGVSAGSIGASATGGALGAFGLGH
jgi:hypothetical protein